MKVRSRAGAGVIAGFCFSVGLGCPAYTAALQAASSPTPKGAIVTKRASGPFDVKLTPQASGDPAESALGRMTIDKQYHGELEGTGKGQMLTAGTSVQGSGAYVAIEHVSATLQGRKGSFILQHGGTMTRGATQLAITVVPDSGTDQLVGLAGKMMIIIAADGKHSYDFEYTLAEAP